MDRESSLIAQKQTSCIDRRWSVGWILNNLVRVARTCSVCGGYLAVCNGRKLTTLVVNAFQVVNNMNEIHAFSDNKVSRVNNSKRSLALKGARMLQHVSKKLPAAILLLVGLSVATRSYADPEIPKPITAETCHPNYLLGNGEYLLGNNHYPAMSYSGDRTMNRTLDNSPSLEELREDLKILSAMGVKIIRTYNTAEFPQSARLLQVIRELRQEDANFEMYVMLGAWINCKGAFTPDTDHDQEDIEWNKAEIDKAIELANAYPDVAKIIAVGNEAMVTWQAHFVHPSVILKWVKYLKQARADGRMPANTLITTSDNWAALGGEASYHNDDLLELLRQIDFVSLHTYAFHGTHFDNSLQWVLCQRKPKCPSRNRPSCRFDEPSRIRSHNSMRSRNS